MIILYGYRLSLTPTTGGVTLHSSARSAAMSSLCSVCFVLENAVIADVGFHTQWPLSLSGENSVTYPHADLWLFTLCSWSASQACGWRRRRRSRARRVRDTPLLCCTRSHPRPACCRNTAMTTSWSSSNRCWWESGSSCVWDRGGCQSYLKWRLKLNYVKHLSRIHLEY